MRALIVTNMWPSPAAPALGSFVRDQVDALRAEGGPGLELEVAAFGPRGYARAVPALRRRAPADVVHAHFGLTAWPALAARGSVRLVTLHGTDVRHPRSRAITRAALPFQDLVATASAALAEELEPPARRRHVAVLPCGVATDRFVPISRTQARERLGLDADGRYLLFPADPARAGKRHDRALEVAARTSARLLTAGTVEPASMPLWVNAANAVVVPSDREGFGLAVLEALACDVPVLATPTGVHAVALEGVEGALCADYECER
jgi:glycosyltransferase involved in cell wall biosynthesis